MFNQVEHLRSLKPHGLLQSGQVIQVIVCTVKIPQTIQFMHVLIV
jgi:hypothetical protein